MEHLVSTRLTTVATFPIGYFLENLAVCSDNSVLVTVLNHKELWHVPTDTRGAPTRLATFEQPAMGIAEVEPDVFVICTSNLWGDHESYLHRLDLTNWAPGQCVDISNVFQMPARVRGLNGAVLIANGVVLIADSFAGLIWRIDFSAGVKAPVAAVWFEHASMASDPNGPMPDQPGINGLAFAERSQMLYYTSTAKQLLMRIAVDPETQNASGEPEFVADGMMGDDLCLDEASGYAYVATHRQNSIDRVPLAKGFAGRPRHSVTGDPFDEELLGPTSGRWSRAPGDAGRMAFFLTDGGIKAPMPDGSLRPARVLRVEFATS